MPWAIGRQQGVVTPTTVLGEKTAEEHLLVLGDFSEISCHPDHVRLILNPRAGAGNFLDELSCKPFLVTLPFLLSYFSIGTLIPNKFSSLFLLSNSRLSNVELQRGSMCTNAREESPKKFGD